MPAEHRLTPPPVGVVGKHPAFGDFLTAGDLPAGAAAALLDWLADALGAWRQAAGPGWQAAFDAAPPVRFWIGPAVTPAGDALRGVMVPSCDAAGRRFPLALMQGGAGPGGAVSAS